MKSRPHPNFDDQTEMTSACKILQELLKAPAASTRHSTGGGMTVSSAGNLVAVPSSSIQTFDGNTNAVIRALAACQQDMVVSPFSMSPNNRHGVFFSHRDDFKAELEQVRQRDAELEKKRSEPGFISRVLFGRSSSDS